MGGAVGEEAADQRVEMPVALPRRVFRWRIGNERPYSALRLDDAVALEREVDLRHRLALTRRSTASCRTVGS